MAEGQSTEKECLMAKVQLGEVYRAKEDLVLKLSPLMAWGLLMAAARYCDQGNLHLRCHDDLVDGYCPILNLPSLCSDYGLGLR